MKPTRRTILLLTGIVLLGAAAFWAVGARETQLAAAAARPPVPDLSNAPAPFRAAVDEADARARTFGRAQQGLEDLAALYHANGRYPEALVCYEGLRRLDPTNPRWYHRPASILAGFGQADEAIALWQRTVELAPDYQPAHLRLGDLLFKANRTSEAAAAYEAVLRQDPNEPYALLGLARIDLEADRLEAARQRLETALAQSRGTLGYDLLVTLYEQLGQPDRALALRSAAKASGAHRDPPDPWIDELLAVCYDPFRLALSAGTLAREGQPDEAIALLWRAIELAPGDVAVRFQLALLARDQKDLATAREQLRRCTVLAPDFPDAWYHLSVLQNDAGDRTAAERTLIEGLNQCPDSPGLHLLRAQRLRDAGRTGEAVAAFRQSIRLRPNEPEAYVELGIMLVRSGNEAEGVRNFLAAWEAEPGNPAALSLLAFQAISSGDEAEARHWMDQVALQPRLPRAQADALRNAFRQRFGQLP